MFKSIVVGFDGSIHSSRALEIGAELAARDDSELGIVYAIDSSNMLIPEEVRKMGEIEHIIEPKPKMLVNFENAPATMMSSMAQAHEESERSMFQYADFLLEQADQIARHAGATRIETRAVVDNPAEALVAFAGDRKADLIITGSRGFGKVKSLLLGSTSHKVAQLAECSCLTVR